TTSAGTLLAEPNPVTVGGVVVDPDAAGGAPPLAGVEVWALRHGIATTTNAQGEFSFTGLVPGIEILSYRRTGYYAETSTDLLLGPGQQVGNANMDLRVLQPSGAGSVEGRVVDGQGQPIAGASVSVSGAHAATTGADGRYSASVAAGEYGVFAIAVSKTGFERQASTPLRVGAGATPWRLKQDFVLEATGATGTLSATTIEPVSGAAAPGEAILWAPKGRIRLVTPASGTRNAAGPAGPLYEEPLFEHWLRRSLASTGTLAVSGTGTPVVPMGSWAVAGRVQRRATGQPIAGAAVTITPPAGMGGPLNLTTDATGWYRYSGSAAGTHQIGVSASGYDPQSRDLTSPLGAFSRFDFQLEGAGAADEGALAVDTPAPGTTLAGEVTTVTATATFPKPGDHIVRAWVELSEGSVVSQTPAYAPNGTQVTVSLVSDSPRGVTQTITVFVETRYGALLTATRDVTMAHALTAVEIPSPLNAGDIVTGSVVLSGPASAGTVVVLTNPNPALLTVPANVSVPSGADRSDFQVTARATPAGGTVTITGTYGVARTRDVVVNAATLGAITGRVVDARTRFPLEGVTVALQPDAGVSAVTNLDGVFTLATVAPGPATVAVEPPQYQLVTGAVTVAAGVTTDAGTLAAEPESVTLSGVVVNPEAPVGSQPIAGVEVWAMRHGLTTTTNAQGEFSFTGLVPGVEILTYRKAGYYAETSTDVLMEPGQVIPNANMDLRVLQPSGAGGFEGRVVDATGTPVAGAAVSVSGYQTTTGADGRYSVAATPGEYGKYAVAVSKPGFARQASTPLRVGEGGVSWRLKRDFVLDATDSEGTWSASTIEPMSGAPAAGEVILWAAQGRIRLVTPASGARSVAGPAGPFYEEPLLEHWLRKNLTAAGTLAVRGVGPAVVPAGQWALAGRVLRRASGQPLAGATVTITPPVGGAAILTTDAAGWYRYASALEGAHQVGVSASGYDPQSRDLTSSLGGFSRFDFHLEGAAGADGGSLVIDAPAPGANVPGEVTTVTATATFPRPGDHIVRAWVALSAGSIDSQTPVYATNGAQVTVNLTSSSPPGVTQTITLRAETLYGALLTATREVTMVHGLTAVGIPSPLNAGDVVTGSVVLSGPASAGAVVALANPNPALLTVPATVPVPAGADRADFQVTAHPSPAGGTVTITGTYGAAHSQDVVVNAATVGSVTGRLVDARTGFGLSSVLVSIPAGPAATTDLEGAFTLTNVEPGPRQIEADRSGYLPLVRSVTVTAGLT
ncbi:MAG: carboxypeptidase regulatory-like domain-containing protein, partial [Acidobacteria bacterium]|nr:carboxypeptidase regulatory-like domain-containing protein [Acidobacteriota bacterium]